MRNCLVFLCVATIIAVGSATDYCSKSCKVGDKTIPNIGCKNNNQWHASCGKDVQLFPFDNALKTTVVEIHNKKRNSIAGGEIKGFKPACRMTTMEWDDELAKLAEYHIKQCKFAHDDCHNTDAFDYSGQNLYMAQDENVVFNSEYMVKVVEGWFGEIKNARQSFTDCYPENYPIKKPMIGHFTETVADRNTRVGCSAGIINKYFDTFQKTGKHIMVTCNYATSNMPGFAVYESCDKAASNCESGTNPKFPNLCSTSENFPVNVFKWNSCTPEVF